MAAPMPMFPDKVTRDRMHDLEKATRKDRIAFVMTSVSVAGAAILTILLSYFLWLSR